MSEEELQRVVDEVLRANRALISQRGERALGAIMGEVMTRVRGRIDGATVSSVVKRKMREFLG
jgi:glutamyl-tRNA(Gln) amidotransferase subunit E